MTEAEIKAKYKLMHDEVTDEYVRLRDNGLLDTELLAIFKVSHDPIWIDMEAELIAEGYLKAPEPVIDLNERITALEDRMIILEKK